MKLKHLHLALVVALLSTASCAKMPPDLTPMAQTAFKQTQVARALDLVRDTAISANAIAIPPLLNEKTTGLVVTWHRTAIVIVNSRQDGWQAVVLKSVDELAGMLPQTEYAHLAPYAVLARTLLASILAMRDLGDLSEDVLAAQRAAFTRSLAIDDLWLSQHPNWRN